MNRALIFTLFSFFLAGIALAVAWLAPLPIPYNRDFSVMYFTNQGLLNGISIYDYPAQVDFVRAQTRPDFTFHPYPYPPWYALTTLFLGLLPIEAAARMWFFVNLGMLAAVTWLLTPRWHPLLRLFAFPAAVMFIPALGLLIVGQYSVPVLLGVALFTWAAREKSSAGAAIALLLMTFKPHIGGFLALTGLGWLLWKRDDVFARRTLWMVLLGGLVLAALGFLADARWPLTYLESLGRYRDIPAVQSCGLCVSLPVTLVRVVSGQSNTGQAAGVSLILVGVLGVFFWRLRARLQDPAFLMASSTIFMLLVAPYLLNYDYILLLTPLFWLVTQGAWIQSGLLYLVPMAALVFGRNGNILLVLMTLICTCFLLQLSPSERSEA